MLHQLVHHGRSFSGHERNCCFLNTGTARFANISSISGLDLADDGRGVSIVDWDQDGDLDVWIVNRNGPQVRFLKNDVPTSNHFLAIRLVGNGTTSNRDAIGARVELITTDHKPQTTNHRPQLRTLRAGDGFLAQSSKWVHFGLGEATQIIKAVVRWPDGEAEEFTRLEVDGRYRLVQGAGQAEPWSAVRSAVRLAPSRPAVPTSTDQVRVASAVPPPMPPLSYLTWEGDQRDVFSDIDGPLLLNLWASWCRPCIGELNELAARQSELREAGLNVLALCVDRLAPAGAREPADAERVAEELEIPFAQGMATAQLIDKLQIVHDELLEDHRPLAVPVSCLIDRRGRLAVIYKGVTDVDQLLADARQLDVTGESRRETSVPFPGRWGGSLEPYRLIDIAKELIRADYLDDAVDYLAQNHAQLASEVSYPDLLVNVGTELLKQGRRAQAEAHFRRAVRVRPNHAAAHYQLGRSAQQAGNTRDAEEHYRQVLRAEGESAETHLQLAMLLSAQEKHAEAIHHLRHCVRIRPNFAPAHFNLAVALDGQRFPAA
jgi:tetratricopeptide (TPR) repeat protein